MKPSIPKGTRDFGPVEVNQRNYIFDTIRSVFVKFGYQPIQTPTMENLSTLTGKYGEEGDKLLFKILNNGDYLAKADVNALESKDSSTLTSSISKRGLRYDLTVPFARYVVMHQNEINFPFKRYQIQPVWRADRPQKGRYNEFYQCDADVVGSNSLMNEAELVQIYDQVFQQLGIKAEIKVNNRKVLEGVAEVAGIKEQFVDMTTAIDKLDKIGLEKVKAEMTKRGISATAVDLVAEMLNINALDQLRDRFEGKSEIGMKGVKELEQFHAYFDLGTVHNKVSFDITLARGLSYYTGCIFEVKALDVEIGSIGGGGRYDNLTGVFGMPGVSGVGISFGAARIFDVMNELNLFPKAIGQSLDVLMIAFDEASHIYAFNCLNSLRAAGVNAELYPEPAKLKKQMKYANSRNVPRVILIGTNEMESGELTFKNMENGEQQQLSLDQILQQLTA